MGLDMYMRGTIATRYPYGDTKPDYEVEGDRVVELTAELGYWRKHPDLHGYIVKNFADGVDECQEIQLRLVDIDQIIGAVVDGKLPTTQGFFFGESGSYWLSREGVTETVKVLAKARQFLLNPKPGVDGQCGPEYRGVTYQASW